MGFNKDSLTGTRRFRGINSVVHDSRDHHCMIPSTPKGEFSRSVGIASVLCKYCSTTSGKRSVARGVGTVGTQCCRVVGKLKLDLSLRRRFGGVSRSFHTRTKVRCTTSEKRFLGNGVVTTCLKCSFISTTSIVHFSGTNGLRARRAGGLLSGGLDGSRRTIVPKFCNTYTSNAMGAFSENNSSIANSLITGTVRTSVCRG